MTNIFAILLIFAVSEGQLLKIPLLSGNINLLDAAVIILVTLGLILGFVKRRKLFTAKLPMFAIPAGIFISAAIISLIFSPLNLELKETVSSFFYTVRFLLYILLGVFIGSGYYGKQIPKKITPILLASGFALSVLGLLQLVFYPDLMFLTEYGWDPHYFRTVSTFLDPNFLGGYLVITLLLTLAYRKHFKPNWLFYISFCISFASLVTTFSRGAGLMLFVSFLAYSVLNKSLRLFTLTLILAAVFVSGYLLYMQNIAMPRNINRDQSAQARFAGWTEGMAMFKISPLLGVGFNSYKYALRDYDLASEGILSQRGATSNDSSLLFVAATTGTTGLVCYIYFLWSLFRTGFINLERKKMASYVLISTLTGLMAHSLFTNSLFYPFFLFAIILLTLEAGDTDR